MSHQLRVPNLIRMRESDEKIVMVTAYDYTFSRLVDEAGVDVILVGDSLGMVVQGYQNTLSVTLEEMIYHSRMVSRGARRALVVADLPFMSFQAGTRDALVSAGRCIKEGKASAVKLEGGVEVADSVVRICKAGIPVMGHVGLTPQSHNAMGGYRIQGRTQADALRITEGALALEEAGAFAVVLEGIPAELAKQITSKLRIPTIGIGAGVGCSGQVLVLHDLLGLYDFEGEHKPKFIKQYASLGKEVRQAIRSYAEEVQASLYPGSEHEYS